jgi:GDP-L-fucose synthase
MALLSKHMKLFITGGTGFIGRNLKEYFSREPKYKIFSPDEKELDLRNSENVNSFLKKNNIDIIIHSATTLRNETSYPSEVCENNLKMFFNLVRGKNSHTKIINLGSGSEYSRSHWHAKMTEEFFDEHVPEDPHSYSKYVISKYIESAKELNALTLRIFGIFGKYEDYRYKFISNAVAKNISNIPITINQNVLYDYIYIDDFCRIIEKIILKDNNYKSYNITPYKSNDLIEIANSVNNCSNKKSNIIILNSGLGITYSGDNSRLINDFGFFDFTSISDAISQLYKYYLLQGDIISKEDLKKDLYLDYAKNLKNKYFNK